VAATQSCGFFLPETKRAEEHHLMVTENALTFLGASDQNPNWFYASYAQGLVIGIQEKRN